MKISKDDFEDYENARKYGLNMRSFKSIEQFVGLSREKVEYITKHYSELLQKYYNRRVVVGR